MTSWIDWTNSTSADWASWLWRVCWQGAIVIAVAWLLTLLLWRSSPWLRSWIWRLAYLKIAILLVWATPFTLALLPASPSIDTKPASTETGTPASQSERALSSRESDIAPVEQSSDVAANEVATNQNPVPETTVASAAEQNEVDGVNRQSSSPIDQPQKARVTAVDADKPAAGQTTASATPLSWVSYLFAAWIIGALGVVIWLGIQTLAAFQLRRSARFVTSPDLNSLVAEVAAQMKLRAKLRLAESELAAGPMLVKFIRPIVVFPAGMLHSSAIPSAAGNEIADSPVDAEPPLLSLEEIRLVLAHELAHLKRHDLAWNGMVAAVHALLYFHPLLWLAHRFARQEQELACDEMVVTQLEVERHRYGEMLVKIVRQIGRGFRPGVAAVGMSASYQTLSRRLTAMQRIRKLTRMQLLFVGTALALLSAVAVVPWRVVAQEVKPQPQAPKASEQSPKAETPAPQSDAKAEAVTDANRAGDSAPQKADKPIASDETLKKRLPGTWRAASGNDVVFNADGSCQDYGVDIFLGVGTMNNPPISVTSRSRGNGNWKIEAGKLTLTKDMHPQYWTKINNTPASVYHSLPLTILRLDDGLLRLAYSGSEGNEAYFLHRIEEKPIDEQYAEVPESLRQFFASARLTPEDAKLLMPMLSQSKIDEASLKTIAQIQQAQQRKITLQELFGMTDDEVSAFRELVEHRKGSRESLAELAEAGELSPQENRAFEKIKVISEAFRSIAGIALQANENGTVPFITSQRTFRSALAQDEIEPRGRGGRGIRGARGQPSSTSLGRGRGFGNGAQNRPENVALEDFYQFIGDLYQWYAGTVFQGAG